MSSEKGSKWPKTIKIYVDVRRKELEFEIDDIVLFKVTPWKGVIQFQKRGKLNPRYIGLFRIIEKIGPIAYLLELPSELSRIHNVFHVSMLRKYVPDPSHVSELGFVSSEKGSKWPKTVRKVMQMFNERNRI